VVNWSRFDPNDYEITFNDRKLAVHDITRWDVMEVLWNGIHVIRDKRYRNRYRVRGRTDAGDPLELIAVDLGKGNIRFITGWRI
jgi:hypothetical protein